MKFEYDLPKTPVKLPVAYMTGSGDLVMKDDSGETFEFNNHGNFGWADWDLDDASVVFYPGDKLTITF